MYDRVIGKEIQRLRGRYVARYRERISIAEGAGFQFDPYLCKKFLECRPELEALYQKGQEEEVAASMEGKE